MKKNRIEKRLTIRIPNWTEEQLKQIQEEYELTKTDIVLIAISNMYKQYVKERNDR